MEKINYMKYFGNRSHYIEELKELFYHVGIVDNVKYKMFANKRVKLMFDIISKELLENSNKFGGNFQITQEFLLPEDMKEDFEGEKVLLIDDCIIKEEEILNIAEEIIKHNGRPPVWTNYAVSPESNFLNDHLNHADFVQPFQAMKFATKTNTFLLANDLIKPEECPNGLIEVPAEVYPFLAFYQRTRETRKLSYEQLAEFLDKQSKSKIFSEFIKKLKESEIFALMNNWQFAYYYDELKILQYRNEIRKLVEKYYNSEYFSGKLYQEEEVLKDMGRSFQIKPTK